MIRTSSLILLISVSFFNDQLLCQSEWKLRKEKEGIKAFTRPHKDYSISEYRVEAEMQSDISSIISLLTEENTYIKVFKDLEELKFLKKEDDLIELYLINKAPFPARNRDGFFISQFSYDSIEKVARIELSCPSSNYHKSKFIEIKRCKGFWEFRQKEENLVQLSHQFIADPGGFVPGFIINIFLVNNPILTIQSMRRLLKEGNYELKEFEFMKN